MSENTIIASILAIAFIVGTALLMGHDGALVVGSVGTLAGLGGLAGGYTLARHRAKRG